MKSYFILQSNNEEIRFLDRTVDNFWESKKVKRMLENKKTPLTDAANGSIQYQLKNQDNQKALDGSGVQDTRFFI